MCTLVGSTAQGCSKAGIHLAGSIESGVILNVDGVTVRDCSRAVETAAPGDPDQQYVGRLHVRNLNVYSTPQLYKDGGSSCDVTFDDCMISYLNQASATAPIFVDVNPTGPRRFSNIRVYRKDVTDPDGLIEVQDAVTYTVSLGPISWDVGDFPTLSPSSNVSATLAITELKQRLATTFDSVDAPVHGLVGPVSEDVFSGATHVVTGIRADARRLTIHFFNISTNGTDDIELVLNPSAGTFSSTFERRSGVTPVAGPSDAILIARGVTAADVYSGKVVCDLKDVTNDRWTVVSDLRDAIAPAMLKTIGTDLLSGALSGFTLQMSGANNFDGAGNISYLVE